MPVFLSVIENLVVLCPSFFVVFVHALVAFTHNSKEPSSRVPGHYKKIMPAQQAIRARVLLLPEKGALPLKISHFFLQFV